MYILLIQVGEMWPVSACSNQTCKIESGVPYTVDVTTVCPIVSDTVCGFGHSVECFSTGCCQECKCGELIFARAGMHFSKPIFAKGWRCHSNLQVLF